MNFAGRIKRKALAIPEKTPGFFCNEFNIRTEKVGMTDESPFTRVCTFITMFRMPVQFFCPLVVEQCIPYLFNRQDGNTEYQ